MSHGVQDYYECGYCYTAKRRNPKILRKGTDREFQVHQMLKHPVTYFIHDAVTKGAPTRVGWKARKQTAHRSGG